MLQRLMKKSPFFSGELKGKPLKFASKIAGCFLIWLMCYSLLMENIWYTQTDPPLPGWLAFIIGIGTVILYIMVGRILAFSAYFLIFMFIYVMSFGVTQSLVEILGSLVFATIVRYALHKRI